MKILKPVCLIEIGLYLYFIFLRIGLIYNISNMDQGLRDMINLYDYENGWGIICLIFLLGTAVLTLVGKKLAVIWASKIGALIYLFLSIGMLHLIIGIPVVCLLLFYIRIKISIHFGVNRAHRTINALRAAIVMLILFLGNMYFPFLNY